MEKRRRKIKQEVNSDDEGDGETNHVRRVDKNGVLRYGGDDGSPVEDIAQEDGFFSTDSDSEDEPPQPEAAGQIKVALFRVLASGEVKRGEYSPQFDAHDDDDNMNGNSNAGDSRSSNDTHNG